MQRSHSSENGWRGGLLRRPIPPSPLRGALSIPSLLCLAALRCACVQRFVTRLVDKRTVAATSLQAIVRAFFLRKSVDSHPPVYTAAGDTPEPIQPTQALAFSLGSFPNSLWFSSICLCSSHFRRFVAVRERRHRAATLIAAIFRGFLVRQRTRQLVIGPLRPSALAQTHTLCPYTSVVDIDLCPVSYSKGTRIYRGHSQRWLRGDGRRAKQRDHPLSFVVCLH